VSEYRKNQPVHAQATVTAIPAKNAQGEPTTSAVLLANFRNTSFITDNPWFAILTIVHTKPKKDHQTRHAENPCKQIFHCLFFLPQYARCNSLTKFPRAPRLSKTLKHLSSFVVLQMGTVTLRSPVRTEDEKSSIESMAKAIVGVDDVRNGLIIVAPNG
jgi:hypothetical protein